MNAETMKIASSIDAETFAMIGKGLIVIGAGLGIGKIGGSAMDAIARQPEATAKIQTAMIIAAALIEGIGFAALFA
jgi:F-type H+-transporting ATPase subunit c